MGGSVVFGELWPVSRSVGYSVMVEILANHKIGEINVFLPLLELGR